ncbi:MAG: hypothetical protein WCA31_10990 [Acidimicrobiales bacterium]
MTVRTLRTLATIALGLSGLVVGAMNSFVASATTPSLQATQILTGSSLHHTYTTAGSTVSHTETLSDPDDISRSDNDLFVGFQNGVGPQGEASSDGNRDSTVLELTLSGTVVAQWDVMGKTDGVTVDPGLGVLATVNEDANSSLYLINPSAPASSAVTHYAYSEALPHNGGTDAISIDHGQILISASAPGTSGGAAPQPTYPAVYTVTLDASTKVATVTPLFYDESSATVANVGQSKNGHRTKLALTDPDSNEIVPFGGRFGGDFMLTSQGDEEQIYVSAPGTSHQSLSVLSLGQSVDDTAWPTDSSGSLFATDSTNDAVDLITGSFTVGQPVVAVTPCGANGAPATCPAAGYPANYLGTMNEHTGEITRVTVAGAAFVPQGGLAFVAK